MTPEEEYPTGAFFAHHGNARELLYYADEIAAYWRAVGRQEIVRERPDTA